MPEFFFPSGRVVVQVTGHCFPPEAVDSRQTVPLSGLVWLTVPSLLPTDTWLKWTVSCPGHYFVGFSSISLLLHTVPVVEVAWHCVHHHVPCFPCTRTRTLIVGVHWGHMVTPAIFPLSRGSCSSWVQPVMCVKSTQMGICIGILLLWVKDRKSLAIDTFLHLINPYQRLCWSYLQSHHCACLTHAAVSDPGQYHCYEESVHGQAGWSFEHPDLVESVQQIGVFSRSVWWKNGTVLLKMCLFIFCEQPNALYLEFLCGQCWSLTQGFFLNREKGERKDWESYSFL